MKRICIINLIRLRSSIKPTPVQIVQVDYPKRSAAVIKEAYFKQSSTTDYNGVYKGRYIDFEAKETKSRTSFPLQNFHDHQIEHMKQVVAQDGICFVIISAFEEIYFWKQKNYFISGSGKSKTAENRSEKTSFRKPLTPFHLDTRQELIILRLLISCIFRHHKL